MFVIKEFTLRMRHGNRHRDRQGHMNKETTRQANPHTNKPLDGKQYNQTSEETERDDNPTS